MHVLFARAVVGIAIGLKEAALYKKTATHCESQYRARL